MSRQDEITISDSQPSLVWIISMSLEDIHPVGGKEHHILSCLDKMGIRYHTYIQVMTEQNSMSIESLL